MAVHMAINNKRNDNRMAQEKVGADPTAAACISCEPRAHGVREAFDLEEGAGMGQEGSRSWPPSPNPSPSSHLSSSPLPLVAACSK